MLLLRICEAVAKSFYGARGNIYGIWEVLGIIYRKQRSHESPWEGLIVSSGLAVPILSDPLSAFHENSHARPNRDHW